MPPIRSTWQVSRKTINHTLSVNHVRDADGRAEGKKGLLSNYSMMRAERMARLTGYPALCSHVIECMGINR
jgi:hypothetical protein